jgi:arginyl-tRNA synthetase
MSQPIDTLQAALTAAFAEVLGVERRALPTIAVGPSQNPQFGDYQCNAAMMLAKKHGIKPRDLAQQVVDNADLGNVAETPEIAGPGFINLRLRPGWVAQDAARRATADNLGVEPAAEPQTVIVEYSSPNIAKELHVGHLRGTILGDAVARVLELLGHRTIRQNHVGDWGTPFGMLIARLNETGNSTAADIGDLDQFYRASKKRFDEDPAFADLARQTVVNLQRGDDAERAAWQKLVEATRQHYMALYQRLGVELTADDERGESFYNDRLRPMVDELKSAGVLEGSDGATVSFHGGFKAPLMVEKSGGGFGYGTTDLAAAEFRAKSLAADRVLYFVDFRQSQHFAQVFATVKAAAEKAGWPTADVSYEHASYGTILGTDNRPLKTRAGDTVKLADVLDEAVQRARKLVDDKSAGLPDAERAQIAEAVGIGAVKYFDLARDRTGDYAFDWDAMLSMQGNTAPYLQYAHCRIRGIFRKADLDSASFSPTLGDLEPTHELPLAKHLIRFGEVAETVARELKPHHLCTHLYELARLFSGFYDNNPVLTADEKIKQHRLSLCHATATTLAGGLDLLGIQHPDRM